MLGYLLYYKTLNYKHYQHLFNQIQQWKKLEKCVKSVQS